MARLPHVEQVLAVQEQPGPTHAALDEVDSAAAVETDDVCGLLGGAWVGEEAVACALWCALKARGDFEDAVLRGANSSGDSDSIACIAGSIVGALVGRSGLPSRWVTNVERAQDLDALAREVCQAKRSGRDRDSLSGALDFFDCEATLADLVGDQGRRRP